MHVRLWPHRSSAMSYAPIDARSISVRYEERAAALIADVAEAQSVNSLNPRPLRIRGTHFSARAARVFACFAPETCKMYDFRRPGVRASNAAFNFGAAFSLTCSSPGTAYSAAFLRGTFFPDASTWRAASM